MGMLDQVVFSSFYLDSLFQLRKIDQSLYLGYLFEDNYEKNKQICIKHHLHVHAKESFLDGDEIQFYHKKGLDINTWDVSNRFRFSYLKRNKVHIVIANKNFKKIII